MVENIGYYLAENIDCHLVERLAIAAHKTDRPARLLPVADTTVEHIPVGYIAAECIAVGKLPIRLDKYLPGWAGLMDIELGPRRYRARPWKRRLPRWAGCRPTLGAERPGASKVRNRACIDRGRLIHFAGLIVERAWAGADFGFQAEAPDNFAADRRCGAFPPAIAARPRD